VFLNNKKIPHIEVDITGNQDEIDRLSALTDDGTPGNDNSPPFISVEEIVMAGDPPAETVIQTFIPDHRRDFTNITELMHRRDNDSK
jgi:hypothetical protein